MLMQVRFLKTLVFTAVVFFMAGCVASGGFSGFERSLFNNTSRHTFVTSPEPVRAGTKSQRFEVRRGDCSDEDCGRDRERVEFRATNRFQMGDERWIAWSIYLPNDFIDISPTRLSIGQIHQNGGPRGTAYGMWSQPPLLQFDILNGIYSLVFHELSGSVDNVNDRGIRFPLTSVASMKGRWTDLVLHIRFGQTNGFAKVYVNGTLKADISSNLVRFIPNHFYWKHGVYRTGVSFYERASNAPIPTTVIYLDEIRLGTSRDEVDRQLNQKLPPVD